MSATDQGLGPGGQHIRLFAGLLGEQICQRAVANAFSAFVDGNASIEVNAGDLDELALVLVLFAVDEINHMMETIGNGGEMVAELNALANAQIDAKLLKHIQNNRSHLTC